MFLFIISLRQYKHDIPIVIFNHVIDVFRLDKGGNGLVLICSTAKITRTVLVREVLSDIMSIRNKFLR